MSSFKNQLAELAQLAQLYLLQEHSSKDWIISEPQSYAYFKKLASQSKPAAQSTQVQQAVTPPRPVVSSPPPPPKSALPAQPKMPVAQEIAKPPVPQVQKPMPPAVKDEPKESPKKTVKQSEFFAPDPMEPSAGIDLSDMRHAVTERLPGMALIDAIPDDAQAKLIKNGKTKRAPHVIVLSASSEILMTNLTKAIDITLAPAAMLDPVKIDKENGWEALLKEEHLRLLLITQQDLQKFPALANLYRDDPSKGCAYLGTVQVIILAATGSYTKDPTLKQALWNTLKAYFPKS